MTHGKHHSISEIFRRQRSDAAGLRWITLLDEWALRFEGYLSIRMVHIFGCLSGICRVYRGNRLGNPLDFAHSAKAIAILAF